jgi:hypothetical protein
MKAFVFLGSARATKRNEKYPENEEHAAMVYVLDIDIDQAKQRAIEHLHETNWCAVAISRASTVSPERLNTMDPIIRNAYETAQQDGVSSIIYMDPID